MSNIFSNGILTDRFSNPRVSVGSTGDSWYKDDEDHDPYVHFKYGIPVWRLDFEHDQAKQDLFFDSSPWVNVDGELSRPAREAFCSVLSEYYAEAFIEDYSFSADIKNMRSLMSCDAELGYENPFQYNIMITLSMPLEFGGEMHQELDGDKVLDFFAPLMKVTESLEDSERFANFIQEVGNRIDHGIPVDENEVVNLFYYRVLR